MKCADCSGAILPRTSVRVRAIRLAASVEGASKSTEERAAFACFAVLFVGELTVRCEGCAMARITGGIAAVATAELTGTYPLAED